ncbi:uncharacterized protein N7511_002085 [Penicillium nucicola]|uniref:uncharacterized protein n=1 Tax=Penicillium nucicola TaxID=1850975 RepID=UPI002544E2F4|nr:uncharacterized protein N7511_002085 [Penicillium nucicola]KAJ5770034.1 hypothetical protein N7511_002085 [Penicillium nucicola]
MASPLPELRWGIIATGMIASWFVTDLSLSRPDARAKHAIRAIGSSSKPKAQKFMEDFIPSSKHPSISGYGTYEEVYADPNIDIVYIATPHAFHKQNCLDAINAGKHVLCEKPFTVNAQEAKIVIDAARKKGVFVMEGLWTRFFPITTKWNELLHEQQVLGDINRAFVDFSLDMPIKELPATSRLLDVKLGAGSLLDIGIYAITWGLLSLETPGAKEQPQISARQTLVNDIDVSSSILLHYGQTGRQGIITSSMLHKSDDVFARVEGSKGTLFLSGPGASVPDTITLVLKSGSAGKDMGDTKKGGEEVRREEVFRFEEIPGGRGFYYEADSIALDVSSGKKESGVMPLDETLRVMQMMDEVRAQGGAKFPQDEQA